MVDLSVQIGEVKLSNPVMPASGTFSYDFAEIIDLNRLGAMAVSYTHLTLPTILLV